MLPTLRRVQARSCFSNLTGAVRGYPGGRLKAIKRRAKTVKTIGKITSTMKIVASSKLPAAQAKAKTVSPFFTSPKDFRLFPTSTQARQQNSNVSNLHRQGIVRIY